MIHTTVGVYADGSHKSNGVPSEDLARHIKYNITFRPGRALFVDGHCINRGFIGYGAEANVIESEWEAKVALIKIDVDTQPYV